MNSKSVTVALIGLTLVVIAVGGVIRIYDAGESCPDWPTCFGTWGFDVSESQQEAWYEENPSEVDSRGSGHRYTTFQIFTEWFHRLLAGVVLGPLVLFNWWLVRKEDSHGTEALMASSISVFLILWQGAIGWLTVKLDNENWSVALHLGSALAFTLSLIWLWLTVSRDEGNSPSFKGFNFKFPGKWRTRIGWLAIGSFISLFSGTFVSTSPGANFGCGVSGFPDSWPFCGGVIAEPVEDIIAQSQMIHRWLVAIVGTLLIAFSYVVWNESKQNNNGFGARNWLWLATAIYISNSVIGATYILSWDIEEGGFEEFLSLIHLILASLTFLVLSTAWLGSATEKLEDGGL